MVVKRLALIVALFASVVSGASEPTAAVRSEFMQAYAAANTGIAVPVDGQADSTALQSYELYPYLQANRLKHALMRGDREVAAVDQAIKTWLQLQDHLPVTNELRRAWLLDLAARQQWTEFLAAVPNTLNDAELRCLNATALLSGAAASQNLTTLATNLVAIWLTANRLPAACNAPFEWARNHQVITVELIEQRVRLALQAGNVALASDLIAQLPAAQAAPLKQWAQLLDKPQAAFDVVLAKPRIEVEPVALKDAWARFARKDQDAALERYARLLRAVPLDKTQASPYALSLALALAWNRRPEALDYFVRVLQTDMTDQAFEWQVRAALWAGDWPRVALGIAVMPDALRNQSRWRYWLARAREQSHDEVAANALYQSLVAADDNYYAGLAAARLQQVYTPHAQSLPSDGDSFAVAMLPGMRRAHELSLVQLRDAASAEWAQAFSGLPPAAQLAAARVAHDWGWYDQAVAITAKLGLYNDYAFLYPHPYDADVAAAAKLSGVSPELIYAVMRQETLFRADAQSSANARGLLQLLPETARITARKAQLPAPTAAQLFEPSTNVPLGALYLKTLLDNFAGQTPLALAAYNAGPAAVRRWLPAHVMDMDVWVENIPFNETRTYVQRVQWHSLVFQWLRDNQPVTTQAWLTPVQP